MPPRVAAQTPAGLLAAMPGYVSGVLETKLVSVFPGNEQLGRPTHQALIAVFDDAEWKALVPYSALSG